MISMLQCVTVCADTDPPLTHSVYRTPIQAQVPVIIIAVLIDCIQIPKYKVKPLKYLMVIYTFCEG